MYTNIKPPKHKYHSPSSFRVLHGAVNRLNVSWRAGFLGEIMGTLLVVFAFLVAYDRRRRLGSDHINVRTCVYVFMYYLQQDA